MWKAIKYILVYIAFSLIAVIAVMIPAVALNADSQFITLIAITVTDILICCYVIRKGEVRLVKETFTIRPWTILLPCLLALLFFMLPESWFVEAFDMPNLIEEDLSEMGSTLLGLITIGIIGPVSEEFLFRGAILNSLLKWKPAEGKPWLAVLLSAVLFSVIHLNPAQMPAAFMMGLFFGWICYRTGSLLPGIVIHVVNNSMFCIVTMMSENPDSTETLAEWFGSPTLEFCAVYMSAILCAAVVVQAILMVKKHYPPREAVLPQDEQEVSDVHPVTPETAEGSIIASQDES
jgi:hypothetical protein